MYEWRAKAEMIFWACKDDVDLRILRMFEGTFSLDKAHMISFI